MNKKKANMFLFLLFFMMNFDLKNSGFENVLSGLKQNKTKQTP